MLIRSRIFESEDFKESRILWKQEYALRAISWECRTVLPVAFNERWAEAYTGSRDPEHFLNVFDRYLGYLDEEERSQLESILAQHLNSVIAGEGNFVELEKQISSLSERLSNSLSSIPNSIAKAVGCLAALVDLGEVDNDQELDAMCLLKEHVTDDQVSKIVGEWKADLRHHLEVQSRPIPVHRVVQDAEGSVAIEQDGTRLPNPSPSNIFWISRDFAENLDAMSRYRFMEVFDVSEFPETLVEIEGLFATSLLEMEPRMLQAMAGDSRWTEVVYDLWLASRSMRLCARIRDYVEVALTRIAYHQLLAGYWASPHRTPVHSSTSCYLTALSCVVILRLARKQWQLERAIEGVKWLVKQQRPSGAWNHTHYRYRHDEIEHEEEKQDAGLAVTEILEEDLFTTLLATEAIKLSGLQGYSSTVAMADSWILGQQTAEGVWEDKSFPHPFMTVLIVEHYQAHRPPLSKLSSFLSMGRDFLLRSQQVGVEDNENSRRLALLLAFQGIEMFLYGCLNHPTVNIKMFEKPDSTIGMRKALTKLQTHYQSNGVLNRAEVIEHRNDLDRLAYHRDQIVHKGAAVSKREAEELVRAATAFVNLNSTRLFGYQLI